MQSLDPTLRLRIYTLDRGALRRQYIPPILRATPMSLAVLLFMFAALNSNAPESWMVFLGVGATIVLIAVIITLVLQRTMPKVLLTSLAIDDQSVTWMADEKVSSRVWRSEAREITFGTRAIDIRARGTSERFRIAKKYFSASEFADIGEQLRLWGEVEAR